MSVNSLYSLEYFNFLGLAHADKNKNGKIDDDEKSIFDEFMKQFDMNKNGKVEEDDVPLYRQSVEFTDDEKNAQKESEEFLKSYNIHPGMSDKEMSKAFSKIPQDELKRFDEIMSRTGSDEKWLKQLYFAESEKEASQYLVNLSDSIRGYVISKFDFLKKMLDDMANGNM